MRIGGDISFGLVRASWVRFASAITGFNPIFVTFDSLRGIRLLLFLICCLDFDF